MTQYISKDALVAEIIRRRKAIPKEEDDKRLKAVYGNEAFVLTGLLEYIDNLEVKEVDLEKEIELVKGDYEQVDVAWNNDFDYIARHFFELGLKAQKGK